MRTAYGFGSDPRLLAHYGWFQDNSEQWSHAAGLLRPNLRGLFDVHGNLSEWCHDRYGNQPSNDATDPTGAEARALRVLRGSSVGSTPQDCRSASRGKGEPSDRSTNFGFRVLRSSVSPASQVKN
jgi:formylglycine-generating enzyme required for sulfatase activity